MSSQHAAQFRKNREVKLRPLSEQEPKQINKNWVGRGGEGKGAILCLKSGAPHETSIHGGWLFLAQT